MQEALPVFLALALMNMIVGTAPAPPSRAPRIFLIARLLYVGIYMSGIAVVRTLVWGVSWVGSHDARPAARKNLKPRK